MSSNNNAALVSILDGTNYQVWSAVIKAFLMAQGLWGGYICGGAERGYLPKDKDKL